MNDMWLGNEPSEIEDDPIGWFVAHKVCPVCRSQATVKLDKIGPGYVISLCSDCGRFIITEECCEELQKDRTGLLHEKAKRWLRETGRHNELRMLSSDPGRVNDPEITEYMDLIALRGMYESSGSKEEYDDTLAKLEQYDRAGKGRFLLYEVLHCFPSVIYDEALVMLDRMEHNGHIRRVKALDDTFFVTQQGRAYLRQLKQNNENGQLLAVPDQVTPPVASAFEHSHDYRSVTAKGKSFVLTKMQAEIVRILDEARSSGHPDVSWAEIASQMSAPPTRISDVFRHNDPRSCLVKRTGRDTYRLNL